MKLNFNEEQIEVLNKLDFEFDIYGDLSDDQILDIDDIVYEYFARNCIGPKDEVNQEGLVCESIMEMIAALGWK